MATISRIPSATALPESGFSRLKQIIGDANAVPPIIPIIPVSKSTWWAGVKSGRYPKPVKLAPRVTAWRNKDILAFAQSAGLGLENDTGNEE
jgi:predicted DNA-binding transcriptional regulator AlpA